MDQSILLKYVLIFFYSAIIAIFVYGCFELDRLNADETNANHKSNCICNKCSPNNSGFSGGRRNNRSPQFYKGF